MVWFKFNARRIRKLKIDYQPAWQVKSIDNYLAALSFTKRSVTISNNFKFGNMNNAKITRLPKMNVCTFSAEN